MSYTKPSCEIVAVRGPTGNPECAEMVASTVLGVSTHAWTSNVLTSSELRRERSTHPFSVVVNVLNLTVKELEGANEWPVIVTLVATFSAAEVGLSFTSFGTLANSTCHHKSFYLILLQMEL